MSLQSNGNSWTLAINLPNRIVRIGIGSKSKLTKPAANNLANNVRAQVLTQLEERKNPGLRNSFGAWLRINNVAPSTVKNHQQVMGNLCDFLGEVRLFSVTPLDLMRWIDANTHAIGTKRKYARVAKAFFSWATRTYTMPINPAENLKSNQPRVAAEEKFTPTAEQVKMLIHCGGGGCVMFAIAALAGLRRGEVLRLKDTDIEFETNKIMVRTERCVEGSKQRYRIVKLDPELRTILWTKAWWQWLPSSASAANKMLTNASKQLGIPFTFNSLRRWRAMSWRGKYPDYVVNKWLGHTEAVARSTYLSVEDKYYDQ